MVMENNHGPMVESTSVTGKTIRCTATAATSALTVEVTKAISLMIDFLWKWGYYNETTSMLNR